MASKPRVLKAIDICDSHVIEKNLLPNIPFRFLLVGRSGSGKSSVLSCMVALPDWYSADFDGDNIYIWSGSKGDDKMDKLIEYKEIPDGNVRNEWHDQEVSQVYDELLDDWREKVEDKKRPNNVLFIVDDLFFSNKFASSVKRDDMMKKVFMNGRKFNISIIILAQKYSSISSSLRENANAMITFGSTNKQCELMEADFNYLPSSKDFYKVFRKATEEKHDFLFINIDLPLNHRYMNKNFESVYNPNQLQEEKKK
jgi:hypothetical protein